jgi:hypothetical protein
MARPSGRPPRSPRRRASSRRAGSPPARPPRPAPRPRRQRGRTRPRRPTNPMVSACGRPSASAMSSDLRLPMRVESTRLIWPAPMPTVARSRHRRWRWISHAWRRSRQTADRSVRQPWAGAWSPPSDRAAQDAAIVAPCTRKPPATCRKASAAAPASGSPPVVSRRRFLRGKDLARLVAGLGGDDDLGEDLGDGAGGFGVQRRVQRDDPPKAEVRSQS